MLIDLIAMSLMDIAAANPMSGAIGLPGGLHYGARASRDVARPFGIFTVSEIERLSNSSRVGLVTYRIEVTVVVEELGEVAGAILRNFHLYWDRLTSLGRIADPDPRNKLVSVYPGESEIGEADETEFGKDLMLGVTSWTMLISEHQPEL